MRKSGVLLLFILVSTATYLLWIVTFEIESISSLFSARKRKLMIVKRYYSNRTGKHCDVRFRLRFNNHKARFRAHSRLSFEGRNKDDLLYRHFFGPGHHGLEDVSIQLIDRVSGEESALRDKEGQWAYRLNCIQPQGLNISDFFYSQNRSTRSRVR